MAHGQPPMRSCCCNCPGKTPGSACCQDRTSGQSTTSTTYTPSWLRRPPPNVYGQGWVCPRCSRVNAPHVPFCGCSPPGVQITSTTTSG